jgi:hypothetical protein
MACNACETAFQGGQPLVLNVGKSGSSAIVSVTNQGRHIVLMRLVILCVNGNSFWFLRPPPDGIPWMYPSAYFEPGIGATLYILPGLSAGSIVQAQAEYIEITGRVRSCTITM